MSKNQFGNMEMMFILHALTDMRSSIYNNTQGFHWDNSGFDMNEIGKAKKKNRKRKRKRRK